MFKDKLKKIFALVSASALLITGLNMLPAEVKAEDKPTFQAESTQNVAPGADVTLKVSLQNCSGLAGGVVQIYYDEALDASANSVRNCFPTDGTCMLGTLRDEGAITITFNTNAPSKIEGMKKMNVVMVGPGTIGPNGEHIDPISGTGTFMFLKFKVPANAAPGASYKVKVISEDLSKADGSTHVETEYLFVDGAISVCEHKNATQNVTKAASCTEKGSAEVNCTDCGFNGTVELPMTEHMWDAGTVTKEPTCKDEGEKTFTCTECSTTKTQAIDKTENHVWNAGVVTKEPTCTNKGVKTYTCTVCEQTRTEELAAVPENHVWNAGVVTKEPTCTNKGEKTFTCTECNATKTEDVAVNPDNHTSDAGVVTKEPTCTEDGVKTWTCTLCNKVLKTEAVTKLGHEWNSGTVTKEPTCTEDGVKTYQCTHTGCTETKTEAVTKLGHEWNSGTVTKEPTCTEDGVKTYQCTHTGCTETKTEPVEKLGHKVDKWTVTKEATLQAEGSKEGVCTVCKQKVTEVIPKLQEADYTKVNELLDMINGLDKDKYTNFQDVQKVIDGIIKGLASDKQTDVDAMAAALQKALDGLTAKEDKPATPSTGDAAPVGLYLAMLLIAAASFAGLKAASKKRA